MNAFLLLILLSFLVFVSSQRESCVCDCRPGVDDSGHNRPGNKPSGYPDRPYTDRPYTERPYPERPYPDRPNSDRPNPNRPIPDRPNPDRPYTGACKCINEYRNQHIFCGSRTDQLVGRCLPNVLYSCGSRNIEAFPYKTCRFSCIEMISEDFHGMDSCKSEKMNELTEKKDNSTV